MQIKPVSGSTVNLKPVMERKIMFSRDSLSKQRNVSLWFLWNLP